MAPKPINENVLFYGDNLPILRKYLSSESVDLVYLDPPFNSNRSYNVLFKHQGGQESEDQIGVFITLEQPTKDMEKEALSEGYYTSELWQKDYPKIQILTIEQLFDGEQVQMPLAHGTFKKAERVIKPEGSQSEIGI